MESPTSVCLSKNCSPFVDIHPTTYKKMECYREELLFQKSGNKFALFQEVARNRKVLWKWNCNLFVQIQYIIQQNGYEELS